MERTLNEALAAVIGAPIERKRPAVRPSGAPKPPVVPGVAPTPTSDETTRLINRAVSQYDKAQEAQRKGDWAAYGEHTKALSETLEQLKSRAR